MDLARISRRIKEAGLNVQEGHGVELTVDQTNRLSQARTFALNAGDIMHSLAIQLVDQIRKDN